MAGNNGFEPDDTSTTEPKVVASTLATFIVTIILVAIPALAQSQELVAGLNDWLTLLILTALTTLSTFVAGYAAKHQYRAGDNAPSSPYGDPRI